MYFIFSVPLAIDMLFRRKNWWVFIQWSLIACAAILLPMARIDSLYYGRLVLSPLNIVMYNVFTSHGPDLYGTEPWYFYVINGFLNFNIMFIAALFTPLALVSHELDYFSESISIEFCGKKSYISLFLLLNTYQKVVPRNL